MGRAVRILAIPGNGATGRETEQLAAARAELTGETETEAVRKALLERLERCRRVPGKRRLLDEIKETAAHCAALPVLDDRGPDALRDLDLLLAKAGIALVPVDVDQAHVARQAHRLFGRGSHAAQLNFGDCFSYAPAQASGEPLLYKGGDFSLTDVLRHPASVQA